MPKIILNGIEYSGNMTIQYNNPAIYSTDEREIGVWTDGKPLYQKTVHINALPSTPYQEITYPHNISDIDTLCDYFGVVRWKNTDGGVAPLVRIYVPNKTASTDPLTVGGTWQFQCTKTNVIIACGSDRSALDADATIRYTKTTDTPGSGTWGTNGCFTEHYSTSEQIVGTWIDGRPIYQKTIPFTGTYNVAAQTYIPHGITNLDLVLKLVGTCKRGNKRIALPFLHHTTDDWSINIYDADASTGNVTLWVGTNNSTNVTDISITMQYVKTAT